jgi:hypothetical protein
VGTWHDSELGRPIAAPLERCAELLSLDLATIGEAAANVEPYRRADGTKIWSPMQLERQLRPEAYRYKDCRFYLTRVATTVSSRISALSESRPPGVFSSHARPPSWRAERCLTRRMPCSPCCGRSGWS